MAATDVMPASPLTPGQNAPWSSFEDYLDLPSPIDSTHITPALGSLTGMSPFNAINSSSSIKVESPAVNIAPPAPPAPSSPPEVLFRYYLAAELRKIGISTDDTIIDRYVNQHYDSFTRAMERHQAQANGISIATSSETNDRESKEVEKINGIQAFRQQANNVAYQAGQNDNSTSIDPQMMELNSLNTSFGSPTAQMTKMSINEAMINEHGSPTSSSSTVTAKQDESMNMDEDDIMSEEEEEEEDTKSSKANSKGKNSANRPLRTIEETPIEGSIMGPSNELRPDPETYHTLTSKEKRQLRNKISARNFRTRRKEHIAQLEQQVADRDTLIEGLRQQLAKVNLKNKELQEEVRSLKTKSISSTDVGRIIDALQKSSGNGFSTDNMVNTNVNSMGPPSITSTSSSSASDGSFSNARPNTPSLNSTSSPLSMSPRTSVALAMPNTRKDVPGTSVGVSGARSFWGGVGGKANGNNFMSVHTVLVPSLRLPSSTTSLIEELKEKKVKESSKAENELQSLIESTKTLNIGENAKKTQKDEDENVKRTFNMSDSDINAALVTLIDGENVPPPSYTEAVGQKLLVDNTRQQSSFSNVVGEGRIHQTILSALEKVLTKPLGSETSEKAGALQQSQLDVHRLQALLDGRARLSLVDMNGRPWQEDCQPSSSQINPLDVGNSVKPISIYAA